MACGEVQLGQLFTVEILCDDVFIEFSGVGKKNKSSVQQSESSSAVDTNGLWRKLPTSVDTCKVEAAFQEVAQKFGLESNALFDHPKFTRFLSIISPYLLLDRSGEIEDEEKEEGLDEESSMVEEDQCAEVDSQQASVEVLQQTTTTGTPDDTEQEPAAATTVPTVGQEQSVSENDQVADSSKLSEATFTSSTDENNFNSVGDTDHGSYPTGLNHHNGDGELHNQNHTTMEVDTMNSELHNQKHTTMDVDAMNDEKKLDEDPMEIEKQHTDIEESSLLQHAVNLGDNISGIEETQEKNDTNTEDTKEDMPFTQENGVSEPATSSSSQKNGEVEEEITQEKNDTNTEDTKEAMPSTQEEGVSEPVTSIPYQKDGEVEEETTTGRPFEGASLD